MLKEQEEQQTEDKQLPAGSFGIPRRAIQKSAQPELKEKIAWLRHEIDAKIESVLGVGEDLRLLKLKQLFDLSAEEIDILLICLIREFDTKYQFL